MCRDPVGAGIHPVAGMGRSNSSSSSGGKKNSPCDYMHACILHMYVYVAIRPSHSTLTHPGADNTSSTASGQQTFWPTHPHPESSRPRQRGESQTLWRSWMTCLLRPGFSTQPSSRLVSDAVVVATTTQAV